MKISNAEGAPFALSSMFDRAKYAPRGRAGGLSGACGVVGLKSGRVLPAKGRTQIPANEVLVLEMPGGGGHGSPSSREIKLIEADLRDELITRKHAEQNYDVSVGSDGSVTRSVV